MNLISILKPGQDATTVAGTGNRFDAIDMAVAPSTPARHGTTGLRQFLTLGQQRGWIDGSTELPDADERQDSLELRLKYVPRFQKLLGRPQAEDVLEIVRIYGRYCIPIPRRTERHYWSISCLPSTSDKPLVRVNASWMELFTIYADGDGIRARVLVHLSDFTSDQSTEPGNVDADFLAGYVTRPEDIDCFIPRGRDMLGINVRGSASIRRFLASPQILRGIRTFVLTHMNRGRNAYQASHCYVLADHMLSG